MKTAILILATLVVTSAFVARADLSSLAGRYACTYADNPGYQELLHIHGESGLATMTKAGMEAPLGTLVERNDLISEARVAAGHAYYVVLEGNEARGGLEILRSPEGNLRIAAREGNYLEDQSQQPEREFRPNASCAKQL